MILVIPDVLDADTVKQVRAKLTTIKFVDGAETAGEVARKVKNNLQADMSSPDYTQLNNSLLPIIANNPYTRPPSSMPPRLSPRPCHPATHSETTIPPSRNGKTNQFGIRRLRMSVTVATISTASVGHQAYECCMCCKANPPEFPVRMAAVRPSSGPLWTHLNLRTIQCVTLGVSSQVYTEVHLWGTPGQSGVYTGVMPINGLKRRQKPVFVYPLIYGFPPPLKRP